LGVSVEIIDDLVESEQLWRSLHPTPYLLDDWLLRTRLAAHYGVRSQFFRCTGTGTILPAGIGDGKLVFFGGLHFAERNRFIGPSCGKGALLSAVANTDRPVRLLNWVDDPLPHLPLAVCDWDVPYNQYWVLPRFADFDDYLSQFDSSKQKTIRYMLRRFDITARVLDMKALEGQKPSLHSMLDRMTQSFRQRGRRFLFEHAHARRSLEICLERFAQAAKLWWLSVEFRGQLVGLGILVEQSESGKAIYLANFYDVSPNNTSGAVILAVIRQAVERRLLLDGMRGSFRLKPRYGLKPEPAYAIVNDTDWKIRCDNDLAPSELERLYGRDFGAFCTAGL